MVPCMRAEFSMSQREALFASEYCKDFNGARAAVYVGYAPKSARITAAQLLTRPTVRKLVREQVERAAVVHGVTRDKLIRELGRIAFANIEDFTKANPDGTRSIDLTNVPRRKLAAVAAITVEEITTGTGASAQTLRRTKLAVPVCLGV